MTGIILLIVIFMLVCNGIDEDLVEQIMAIIVMVVIIGGITTAALVA